ncbi:hypothetical protein [Streptomyces swartbergensis]|uniref:hypothetical protein n=1 Tax=Streptomyces swartbergensis TaxID=487165 RepID=UPI003CC65B98
MAIHLRVPGRHEGTPQVRVNGAPPEGGPAPLTTRRGAGGQPLTYVRLERQWREGDTITVRLRPRVSAELLPDGSPWVSFRFGPTVLAAEGDRNDLVWLFADDSRMGHAADGPLPPGAPAHRPRPEFLRSGGRRTPTRPGPAGVRPGARGRATG